MREDEDYIAELKQQAYEEQRARRNLSCTDGFCGADDCARCRPGSYQFFLEDEK